MGNSKQNKELTLTGENLTIESLYEASLSPHTEVKIKISDLAKEKMARSRAYVHEVVKKGQPVYGINTGFGALSSKFIPEEDLATLQVNLIRSHCTGIGEPFSEKFVRAIMILRANCLCSGFSGINPEIVNLLKDFVNIGIVPIIPQKGSVGASGDLAPLAHLALALIGEGEVIYKGEKRQSIDVLKEVNLKPAILGPKDGLALINGTAIMAALGAMAVYESKNLIKLSDIACALTVDGIRGTSKAFDLDISNLKPHPGQKESAANLEKLLTNSELMLSHSDCERVQDPYSLRCAPQVHGAIRQTIRHAEEVVQTELNSITDNPLIFCEKEKVISGGNFHGQALSFCMDYLAMGLAEICNISERRVEKMMNPSFSELPAFLTKNSGLNSGLMIAHVSAAALTSENKVFCHPASVDSIPTSTDKEDHVSMGVTAGLKLWKVLENVKACLAIEILCNTQALEFQRPHKSTPALESVYNLVRETVPPIEEDRVFYNDIQNILNLVEKNNIITAVENNIGELK